ncbi:MAG: hypothetical protein ABJ139_02800 [Paracoccaceae bacterium]
MTPSFALSLSYERIRLLHRAAGGWQKVGDVPLTVEDLSASLRVLKKTATALHASTLRTKLIIPSEQIRFLKIETGEQDLANRRIAAEQALDGVTPYDIADLSIDVLADGPITYVAAVARETLAEAESFAVQHGFDPVSFVASPEPSQFDGEPFFGPTIHAASVLEPGEFVSRDRAPVTAYAPPTAVTPTLEGAITDEATVDDVSVVAETDLQSAPDEPAFETHVADDMPDPQESTVDDADLGPVPETTTLDSTSAPEDDEWALSKIIDVSDANGDVSRESIQITDFAAEETPDHEGDGDDAPAGLPNEFIFKDEPEEAAFEFAEEAAPFEPASDALESQSDDDISEFDLAPEPELQSDPADPEPEPEFQTKPEPEVIPELPLVAQFSTRRNPDNKTPKLGGVTRADAPPLEDVDPNSSEDTSTSAEKPPIAIIRNEDAVKDDRYSSGQRAPALSAPHYDEDADAREFALNNSPKADAERLLDEADRLTVFGARQQGQDMDGRPKLLGIVLGVFVFVFLAGIASWATVFSDGGLASLFDDRPEPVIAEPAQPIVTPDALPTETTVAPSVEDPAPDTELASLQPELTDEDAAVLDALVDPRPEPADIGPQTEAEKEADYAVTGIWATAPVAPAPVSIVTIDDVYETSIDPGSTLTDAIALAPPPESETALLQVPSPAAPGIAFDLDDRGLVKPTPEGTLNPEGVVVFSGPPLVKPPLTPERPGVTAQPAETAQPEVAVGTANTALAAIRPRLRPSQLVENTERSALGGPTLAELATIRPVNRPPVSRSPEQQRAEIDEALAVAMSTSVRPNTRPGNFSRVVARATPAPTPVTPETEPEPTRTVRTIAPRTVKPAVPTSASVTRQATLENAINLRKVNLIGVFGKPSERRALVRMPNGRYKKVQVGDNLDGGRVSAIGDSELRYSKGARNVMLRMPKG